jgi:hypothetical protein
MAFDAIEIEQVGSNWIEDHMVIARYPWVAALLGHSSGVICTVEQIFPRFEN